jgi:ClpP class serine protease
MITNRSLLSIDSQYAGAFAFADLPISDKQLIASMYTADDLLETRIGGWRIKDAVAVVDCVGLLSKQRTPWGSGYVDLRQTFRLLAKAELIDNVLIRFDSPGGGIAGCADAAADLAKLAKVKIVNGFVEDVCCGSAMWLAAQCSRLACGSTALVGSLGLATTVVDSSTKAKRNGIRVHRIAGGDAPHKGAGMPGTTVSRKQLAEFKQRVDQINAKFKADVKRGRRLTTKQLDRAWSGGAWIGSQAKAVGLADRIESFDDLLARLSK